MSVAPVPGGDFEVFFTSNPNPMWIYEQGTLRFLAVNDAAVQRYGHSREEFLRMTLRDIRPPEDVPDVEKSAAAVSPGFRPPTRVWRHLKKDGTAMHVEIHAHSVEWRGVQAMLVLALDVGDRLRAEWALAESEERFRQLVASVRQVFWLRDLATQRYLYVSPAYEEVWGRPVSSLAADPHSFFETVHPEDRPRLLETTGEAVRDAEHEFRILRPDGSIRWILARWHPVRDAAGAVYRLAGVAEDVTDRKEMQARLALADRMASVGTLAAGVAHEINNPLAYALTNLEFVREQMEKTGDPGIAEVLSALGDAREGIERVRHIVRDLKSFSRPDDARLVPVELPRIVDVAVSMASNEIKHRATLLVDLAPVPPVLGTEARLGQVLLNLLLNAAHAIPEGDAPRNTIHISGRLDGRWVVLEVRDTGSGIPPDVLPHIFEPFYTTKRIGEGTGLGLSICHGIVGSLGGDIAVESEPGKGSLFRVRLPPCPAGVARAEPPPPPPAPSRAARILVVDDERAVGLAVARILLDHDVTVCTGGRDALARIRGGERFDVLLCDLMMPDMTGLELHDALAAEARDQRDRMVFLTGGAFTPRALAFLRGTDLPALEKPFGAKILRDLVARQLGQSPGPAAPHGS